MAAGPPSVGGLTAKHRAMGARIKVVDDKGRPCTVDLNTQAIVASVQSLYDDELKPFGRVLLRRLREYAAREVAKIQGLHADKVDPETMPLIDPKWLRKACMQCSLFEVVSEYGREYSVMLRDRAGFFIDICSPHDFYPEEFWDGFKEYLEGLDDKKRHLPGGRYACARVLVGRNMTLFKGFSLGQVCHVVQMAISQKRLLGYLDGELVPYWHSGDWLKARCAVTQSKYGTGVLPVASWDDVRSCLHQLLDSSSTPEPGVITISNVKRPFRSRFEMDLSYTVLGHTRLSDLLHDTRLRDICTLHAEPNGHVFVKKVVPKPAVPPGTWFPQGDAAAIVGPPPRPPPAALGDSEGERELPRKCEAVSGLRGSLHHVGTPQEGGPQRGGARSASGKRRSNSVPKDMGLAKEPWQRACFALQPMSKPAPLLPPMPKFVAVGGPSTPGLKGTPKTRCATGASSESTGDSEEDDEDDEGVIAF